MAIWRNSVIQLERSRAQLLVVDVQEKLLPHITNYESVLSRVCQAIHLANTLEIPVTLSEQYPQGLGPTACAVLESAGKAEVLQKLTFSVCRDQQCAEWLARAVAQRPIVLIAGIETHVCVMQTALDLLARGACPVLLADAAGSRRALDRDVATARMSAAGVTITSVESAAFELTERCDTPLFKAVLKLVK